MYATDVHYNLQQKLQGVFSVLRVPTADVRPGSVLMNVIYRVFKNHIPVTGLGGL
jgi:hypothetical protein